MLTQRIGNLRGHPLLDLRSARVDIHQPRQLGQPSHPSLAARDVADVSDPVEGHEMVLTGAVDLDVAHEDELVVAYLEVRREDVFRLLPHAREDLDVDPGPAAGSPLEPVAFGVLAVRQQKLTAAALTPLRSIRAGVDMTVLGK